MVENQSSNRIYQSVYYLAIGLIYFAVFLRTILFYQGTPYLGRLLGLMLCFLLVFLAEYTLSRRVGKWFNFYLGVQSGLIFLLFFYTEYDEYDYMSLLFAILGMQAMQHLDRKSGTLWIVLFFILFSFPFIRFEGPLEGVIRVVLFGSVIIFLSAYSLATRHAQEARSQNQSLMQQLQTANLQLETHSDTLKQLGAAHERQRLRRELHDSVTQTIFSMTLTTQSALLLLDRDLSRVGTQLERLNQLAQSALAEMHTLISELRPERQAGENLEAQLRKHIDSRHIPEGLTISLHMEGEERLSSQEEQGLFRITQEALNNVIKHARASKASLHLHMVHPLWIEITDNGQGFSLEQAQGSGRLGLSGMQERADEISWELAIRSAPADGTRIRVEKKYPSGEKI
jgi:signal transduction histidine kinase